MEKTRKFKPVDPKQDFVAMEKKLLDYWYENGIIEKYLKRNQNSKKKFSFLDLQAMQRPDEKLCKG